MIPTIVVVVLLLTGAGFLLAASYMALAVQYSPAVAAAFVGGGLFLLAAVTWLVSEALANRRHHRGGIAPIARAAIGAHPTDDTSDQIIQALKQESPLSVIAAAAGLLVGLFLRERRG